MFVLAATFISLEATPSLLALDGSSATQWMMGVLLTVMAPLALQAMLALLVTHGSGSVTSGYLAGVGYWLVNLISEGIPMLGKARPFLLFGWTFPGLAGSAAWFAGKGALCVMALVLLALEVPILRKEIRLVRNRWE